MKIEQDSAQVKIPPPVILLGFIGLGYLLNYVISMQFFFNDWRWFLGLIIMGEGFFNIFYCAYLFKKNKTNVEPWKETKKIVSKGLYKFTRNPIYLSFVLIGIGTSLMSNNVWILIMMIPFIYTIQEYVIKKEEKYLKDKFGEEYKAYKSQVKRWI